MKNFRLYTLLALLLMAGKMTIQAQEYMPIIQDGNEWNTLSVGMSGWNIISYTNYVNWCSGDTIINDVRYAKLMGTTDGDNPHLFSLLREEYGKVWQRRLNNPTEVLLYDFTSNVGDTLRVGIFDEYLVVDSISIEHIGGVDRKKYWFGLEYDFIGDPYAVETWTEGIGSSFGLLCSGYWGIVGGYYCALCFHENGELIWQNPEYDACTVTAVDENQDSDITIYPNPTNGLLYIDYDITNVEIYNILGQLVKETKENVIDLSAQEASTYLLKVITPSGVVTKQIIKN